MGAVSVTPNPIAKHCPYPSNSHYQGTDVAHANYLSILGRATEPNLGRPKQDSAVDT